MPNVVLEALAFGVPVVATDVGDTANMLPQSCGALVPPDPEQLASAILRVIADAPAYRHATEGHAASMAATYSSRAMANRTVDVWRAFALRGHQPEADPFARPSFDAPQPDEPA